MSHVRTLRARLVLLGWTSLGVAGTLTTTAVAARTRVPSPVLEDWLDIGCYSSVPGPSQGVKSW